MSRLRIASRYVTAVLQGPQLRNDRGIYTLPFTTMAVPSEFALVLQDGAPHSYLPSFSLVRLTFATYRYNRRLRTAEHAQRDPRAE